MGKAAKKERREQKKLEEKIFEIFEKSMTKISESEKEKFFIKTGIIKFIENKPYYDPQAYYKTAFTFVNKFLKLSEDESNTEPIKS